MTEPFSLGTNNILLFFVTCNPHFCPSVRCIQVSCLLLGASINSVQHTLFKMPSYMELHGVTWLSFPDIVIARWFLP